MLFWINGHPTEEKTPQLCLSDPAFLFGFGVFETLRTHQGQWLGLAEHVDRLYRSAQIIGLTPSWKAAQVKSQVQALLAHCPWPESRLKIILTQRDLILMAEELKEKPVAFYEQGVKAISFPGERALPLAKTLGNVLCHVARQKAQDQGVYEAILIDGQHQVREGAASNLFWVKAGQLYTCDQAILKGLTRQTVIELADPCTFEEIHYPNLLQVEELFLTQTSSGIVPLVEVDQVKIGTGLPGRVTQELMERWENYLNPTRKTA